MKKNIVALLIYLGIFAAIFGLSVYSYLHDIALFDIGMSAQIIDLMVILLSSLAIIKTTYHLYRA
jgi:hypothetical protein